MNVLLVAPTVTDPPLPQVDAEIQAVVNSGLQVRLLHGSVSQRDVMAELAGRAFDVLWLATHGDAQGVLLSDGKLSAGALTTLVRSSRVPFVFLNTCDSVQVALAIQQEANVAVVCTVAPVPDVDAFTTGSIFAQQLARTGDTRMAYEASKPGGNRVYLYLAPPRSGDGDIPMLRRQVERINAALIRDNPQEAHNVITDAIATLTRLDERLMGVEERVANIEQRMDPPPLVWALRLAALAVLVFAGVFFMVPDNRTVLMEEHPVIGIVTLGVLMSLAAVIGRQAQLEARKPVKRGRP